jgi:hypothetical protein
MPTKCQLAIFPIPIHLEDKYNTLAFFKHIIFACYSLVIQFRPTLSILTVQYDDNIKPSQPSLGESLLE